MYCMYVCMRISHTHTHTQREREREREREEEKALAVQRLQRIDQYNKEQ